MEKPNISITRILEISIPALIVFAVSWGIYTTKSSAQEAKIVALEQRYETLLEMKMDIAVLKEQMIQLNKNIEKVIN